MNAAAWPVYSLRFSDHISDALVSLHWLWSPERVMFKFAVLLMFKPYMDLHWFVSLTYPDVQTTSDFVLLNL